MKQKRDLAGTSGGFSKEDRLTKFRILDHVGIGVGSMRASRRRRSCDSVVMPGTSTTATRSSHDPVLLQLQPAGLTVGVCTLLKFAGQRTLSVGEGQSV